MMAAELEMLKLSVNPYMGIRTLPSAYFMASSESPVNSVPNRKAVFCSTGRSKMAPFFSSGKVAATVNGEPFVGTHADLFVGLKLITVLNHMHILYPVAVAGPQYGADVLGLEKVLQHHCDVAGAVLQDFRQTFLSAFSDELFQVFYDFLP